MLCVHPGELGRNRFPVGQVPVLFMRINVAKEDGYLCRILAVEVRRVKCVFPRNCGIYCDPLPDLDMMAYML